MGINDDNRGAKSPDMQEYARLLEAAAELREGIEDRGPGDEGWDLDTEEIEQCYRAALQIVPDSYAANAGLAAFLYRTRDGGVDDEVLELFAEASKCSEADGEFWREYADALFDDKRHDEALAAAEKALAASPPADGARALHDRIAAAVAKGRRKKKGPDVQGAIRDRIKDEPFAARVVERFRARARHFKIEQGDLHPLEVAWRPQKSLVVMGDLTTDSNIVFGPFQDAKAIIVLGNLRARNIYVYLHSGVHLAVAGDVRIDEVLYLEDGSLLEAVIEVGGRLSAQVIVNHHADSYKAVFVHGEIAVPHRVGFLHGPDGKPVAGPLVTTDLTTVFSKDVLNPDMPVTAAELNDPAMSDRSWIPFDALRKAVLTERLDNGDSILA